MADEVDIANDNIERELAARLAGMTRTLVDLVPGEPGDCDLCGEWSGRLVLGVCAPCRDKRRLP